VSILSSANALGMLQLARGAAKSWRTARNEVAWPRYTDGGGILLLPALAGSPRLLHPMRNYLQRELMRPALDFPLGVRFGDICNVAMRVHLELGEQGVHRCDVIGYSMGGLVAAYLVKCLDQGRCIRRVVTLGTPYHGVPFLNAWWWQLARWFRSAQQMRAGSAFLDHLRRIAPPTGTSLLSIVGSEDTIVPPAAAHLEGPGCRSLVIPGLDHWTLPTSRRVFRCLKEVLLSERGRLPSPRLASQPLEMVR